MRLGRPLLWLALSVGLNLLLGGVLVGSYLAGSPREKPPFEMPGSPRHGPQPPHARRIAGEVLAPHREELRERRKQVAAARAEARAALEREPYDPEAFERALTRLRAETTKSQEAVHRAMARAAASADPERRRLLKHMLERERGR
ncbi:MAG: periplasmic heavy metal sensor [Pseudomonadota bacterium]|nr:MAG: hypothetical protein DIU78_00210 [Pseudomonadota bacterium]